MSVVTDMFVTIGAIALVCVPSVVCLFVLKGSFWGLILGLNIGIFLSYGIFPQIVNLGFVVGILVVDLAVLIIGTKAGV